MLTKLGIIAVIIIVVLIGLFLFSFVFPQPSNYLNDNAVYKRCDLECEKYIMNNVLGNNNVSKEDIKDKLAECCYVE